jgi:GT2 family glycosyltransferase
MKSFSLNFNLPIELLDHMHFKSMVPKPLTGWYMVELIADVTHYSGDCSITLEGGDRRRCYSFKPHASQPSKRILYFKEVSKIDIVFKSSADSKVDVRAVKLIRLANFYAKKLIIKKLRNNHPKYNNSQKQMRIEKISFGRLWREYCQLFGNSNRLFSYLNWAHEFDSEGYSQIDARLIDNSLESPIKIPVGDWVFYLRKNFLISRNFQERIQKYICNLSGFRIIYADSDHVDELGNRTSPQFNPDWNRDLFYSKNYFAGLVGIHNEVLAKLDFIGVKTEGELEFETLLRALELVTNHEILHVPFVLSHKLTSREAKCNETALLNEHFSRIGVKAIAELGKFGRRIRYTSSTFEPLVSIIIPSRNQHLLLSQCVNSIVEKTIYSNYEIIIIDNGSDEPDALSYLDQVVSNPIVRVMQDQRPFNFSSLNNFGVNNCNGKIVALLNNDVEVFNRDWLCEMVSHALRPEVGVVGAKLYYPNGTIQHAGIVLGIHGIAGHVHRFFPKEHAGYCGRANLIQSFSAVTGACMAVRKDVYLEVGGMNEELPVACNDIDFCLKIRAAGYTNIWTPYAELYHHESASRGIDDTPEKITRAKKEVEYMKKTWGDIIKNDPAYNPNLTLDFEDFSLAWPPRVIDNITTSSGANH